MSIDPRLERSVLAEFAFEKRRARGRDGSHGAVAAAGLTREEVAAIKLPGRSLGSQPLLQRVRTLCEAPGTAGTLTALVLLPDPRLSR